MRQRLTPSELTASNGRIKIGVLLQNAAALMLSSGGTAILGVVFWGLATHLVAASAVGRASAEIAAMTLLASLAQLSFGPIFERFLPVAGRRTHAFITRAYAMCLVAASLFALGYVLLGFGRRFIPASFGWQVLFIASVVLWTIFILQDSALIGLRASRWVPVENILFAAAKLALLPLIVIITTTQGIFLAWTTPVAGAILGVNWYLFKKRIPEHQLLTAASEDLPSIRQIILLTSTQYAGSLLTVITSSLVSLIVIDRLGAVAAAHYYLPSLVASGPSMVLYSLLTSFLVEASSEPHLLRKHTNVTIRAAVILLLPCLILGELLAPEILRIFGTSYAKHGTTLLRLLLLGLPGTAVSTFYLAFAWLDKRVWWLAARQLVASGVYFAVLFVFIGHFGVLAIGIAAVTASGLEAILFLPGSIKRYRRTTNTTAV